MSVAHTTTANASHCSCGALWLDHCETLVIKNEKLVEALRELLVYATDGAEPPTRPNPHLIERAKEALKLAEGK